ncbi:fumarylacetoacetate hydrolase family protein [Gallaecimonas kandeliae]|uniref:fumarylacetoacetate hydrolase family protein n=1 Tax=Gallaecimonas kandeliae TaxID=3029055 RepID=UPI002647F372|nr:fumarylacetoacetate hydrolase family protein [Gallaecimonas kandeliae]WKE67348.1 fumarylacetoacetate hydrolase family protein [Gallaecimonas kandeliae]
MALHIVRFRHHQQVRWGFNHESGVRPLPIPCTTTAELLAIGYAGVEDILDRAGAPIAHEEVELLSPITAPTKVLCQGANYRQHMIDSGMDPDAKKFNMFFTKSAASITAPTGWVVKPKPVQLLDYELELTLVLGKRTQGPVDVNSVNLHEYVAGICIGNDFSARDIQIPQMQFHKGKSYRTFCPLGPVLCLLDRDEMRYLDEMQLMLTVNGERRQFDSTANLVFKPAETLTEFSRIHDFEPGDVLMTGTPSGCALGLPSPLLVRLLGLLPEEKKWALFLKAQKRRRQYLKVGDKVESCIASHDGRINLGMQRHEIGGEA